MSVQEYYYISLSDRSNNMNIIINYYVFWSTFTIHTFIGFSYLYLKLSSSMVALSPVAFCLHHQIFQLKHSLVKIQTLKPILNFQNI